MLVKTRENMALFPAAEPYLADIDNCLQQFIKAMTDAVHRDKRMVVIRNQQKEVLKSAMSQFCHYVNQVTHGDEAHVLASGFDLPDRSTDSAIPAPEIVSCRTKINSKTIWLRAAPWRRARVYLFEYRRTGSDEPWRQALAFKTNCTIGGLEQFAEYDIRLKYVGTDGESGYSHVITTRVH